MTQEGNRTSKTRIVPPFADELGPKGTATHGIDLESNRLTGGVIHYSDSRLVASSGEWRKETLGGMWGLFTFHQLKAAAGTAAEISYTLPVSEDGTYQIALLYKPAAGNASNARIAIHHAEGVAETSWNMKEGSKHGFAVEVGKYPFKQGKPAGVVISAAGADGMVVADSVAFVKVSDDFFLEAKNATRRQAKVEGDWQEGEESAILRLLTSR